MTTNTLGTLIKLLIRHERELHNLYLAYAGLFPAHREFWMELAEDEGSHAEMLEELQQRHAAWVGESEALRFRPASVQQAIDNVAREIAHAKGSGVTHGEALAIAVYQEHALIESRFYEAFAGAPEDLAETFARMRALLADHVKRVDEAWASEQDATASPA